MRTHAPLRRHQHGFTLVELMVGLAIGLMVAAIAFSLLGVQAADARRQLIGTRLTQDLQTLGELIARDLSRAGHGMPLASIGAASDADPAIALTSTGDGVSLLYATDPSPGAGTERFSYRLHHGVVEMAFGDGSWQALSDATTMLVTQFDVEPDSRRIELGGFCSRTCPSGQCPFQLQRRLHIRLQARAVADPAAQQETETIARVRNHAVLGGCPA